MKKAVFIVMLLLSVFLFISCVPSNTNDGGNSSGDSISNPAPLEILEKRVETENNFGLTAKLFYVVTKNISDKTIIAYKVEIIGYNAFDEQVNIDFKDSLIGLVQDVEISPGEKDGENTYWLSVYADGVSYIEASIIEVRYKDGSKWEK
ncbi:DUF5780 domain-containing protein [Oceanotoga teriensis]|uniref:DUF5780 domain-containing protein n=1 Tax=Oceanotoga teriensis TaxID=515440 RepID=UPI002712D5E4|nr:DUF5780 domain-containing protein [Oceanotoga teriensis]MDO7976749.1 DUF5780 domain-containing protein [Oceanotoga teriensis]